MAISTRRLGKPHWRTLRIPQLKSRCVAPQATLHHGHFDATRAGNASVLRRHEPIPRRRKEVWRAESSGDDWFDHVIEYQYV